MAGLQQLMCIWDKIHITGLVNWQKLGDFFYLDLFSRFFHAAGNLKKYINISLELPIPNQEQACLQHNEKGIVSLSCDRNPLCIYHSSVPYHVTHVGLRDKSNKCKYVDIHADFCTMSNNIFCYLARSLLSSNNIHKTVTGYLISRVKSNSISYMLKLIKTHICKIAFFIIWQ